MHFLRTGRPRTYVLNFNLLPHVHEVVTNLVVITYYILGDPGVTANIYTANHATFPIGICKITVQIWENFWITQ